MKKSRIAKLALMGASVTALAATLTTSTYAWYVSNKTATVNQVLGSTSSATSDGSISLSLTGAYNTFYNEITLGNFNTASLSPVVTADGKTFYSLAEDAAHHTATPSAAATVATTGETVSDSGKVYKYVFYIKSDAAVTVTPTITITNTTSTFTPQVNYASQYKYTRLTAAATWAADTYYNWTTKELTTAQPDDWATYANYCTRANNNVISATPGQSFYVDALNAMSLSYWETTSAAPYAADYSFGSGAASLAGFQTLSEGLTGIVATNTPTVPSPTVTTGAVNYYEEITGNTLTDNGQIKAKTPFTNNTAMTTISLAANTPKKLEYYLWIDGADEACFNACELQSFTVEFSYTVSATNH